MDPQHLEMLGVEEITGPQTLRPYQVEGMMEPLRGFFRARQGSRPILQAIVGAGKTVVASTMIQGALEKGRRSLFICERITLVEQAARRFAMDGLEVGILQANHPVYNPDAPVQCASIQTIARRSRALDRLDIGIVFIDEAHVFHKAHKDLMQAWSAVPFVGLSATPWSRGLGEHYSGLVVGPSASELIAQGFLVPTTVYGPSQTDLKNTGQTDFSKKELDEWASKAKLVADVVETWHKRAHGLRTIGFAVDIGHSKHLVEEFQKAGVSAEHMDAYTPREERQQTFKRFDKGETQIIWSCDVLGRGFDQPKVECVIQARPTRSLILHVQQLGRGLRCSEGKRECLILDHAGNHERLGFITDEMPTSLDMGQKGWRIGRKKDEPLPKACPKCYFMRPARVNKCPQCGFAPSKRNRVAYVKGELELLQGKARKERKLTLEDKAKIWQKAYWVAIGKNMKIGAAAHMYKQQVGSFPRGFEGMPQGKEWQMKAQDFHEMRKEKANDVSTG